MKDTAWRKLAKDQYQDDDLEINEDAKVSVADDPDGEVGAWVQAWVWVDRPEE